MGSKVKYDWRMSLSIACFILAVIFGLRMYAGTNRSIVVLGLLGLGSWLLNYKKKDEKK